MTMMNKIPKKIILKMLDSIIKNNDDIIVETLAAIDAWLSDNIIILNVKEQYYYFNFFPGSKIIRKELTKDLLNYFISHRYNKEYARVLSFEYLDVNKYKDSIEYVTSKVKYYSVISDNNVNISQDEFNNINNLLTKSNELINSDLEECVTKELDKFKTVEIVSDIYEMECCY